MSATMTSPTRLEPPVQEPMLDEAGIIRPVWAQWFQALADRQATGNAGSARTGSVLSGPLGEVAGTFDPPFVTAPVISLYDATGTLVALTGIAAGATGFTGTAPLPIRDYTWVAIG
jgi:hypothetical protein